MRVRIISNEEMNGWILGKFARKLRDELLKSNVDIDIHDEPDPAADINHYMLYLAYDPLKKGPADTLMITHIDNHTKLAQIKTQMDSARLGICMSAATMKMLQDYGVDENKLCYVNPAHDAGIREKKICIGLATNVYVDGRKREQLLLKLAESMDLRDFTFKIMGEGWDNIISSLEKKGISVQYYNSFDYDRYLSLVSEFDYYLYMGQDEGSMGFVDALAAGVKTIVTPQGYHLDANDGITHAFDSIDELIAVFKKIAAAKRKLTDAVATWTWDQYAMKHLELWNYLVHGNRQPSVFKDGLNSLLDKSGRQTAVRDKLRVRYGVFLLTLSRFMHSKDKWGKIKRKLKP